MEPTNYAVIKDSIVVNVIFADEAFINTLRETDTEHEYVKLTGHVGIGCRYTEAAGFVCKETKDVE